MVRRGLHPVGSGFVVVAKRVTTRVAKHSAPVAGVFAPPEGTYLNRPTAGTCATLIFLEAHGTALAQFPGMAYDGGVSHFRLSGDGVR